METPVIIGITPFEKPDVSLALALSKAKAFPVLHLGRDRTTAKHALEQLSQQTSQNFGVCYVSPDFSDITLPDQVTLIITPYGINITPDKNTQRFYQVHNLDEALKAAADKADGIIIKGNESAGKTGDDAAFILFQRVRKALPDARMWVQGGAGIHTTAALIATGAKGVVLDSQLILFPECSAPAAIKNVCEKLNGNETKVIDHYRVLVRPNSPALDENARQQDLEPYLRTFELDKGYLPLGQDIAISTDLVNRYRKISKLITGIHEAIRGHHQQSKALNIISPGNALSKELNISYPIAQGPMTRVSDVPAFAAAVATAGALPFVALSLLKGDSARQLIRDTQNLLKDKTWGVGILGFAPQELRDEQIEYIKAAQPPLVLIAGGRPSQAKALEATGIKTFLHVPSASLLDMFLKEGARRFVFEGRECGGHVGPLSSLVLWEKQVERLLLEDQAEQLNVFFAGGIHDALSAAFISVMTAPLAAKGAKIGVLMGTSYIYTKEAVETGAILPQFQQLAIAHTDTVLLETAPGHETRCLNSPFTGFFAAEKSRLAAEKLDKKEIWAQLEQLNVGRLRIATKGIDRKGDQWVNMDEAQQLSEGMYMIGQVAALRNQVISMADLHKEVAENNFAYIQQAVIPATPPAAAKALDVAIIGMACIYPGAKNIEEYWHNIISGKDCVTEVPDERWNKALYYDPAAVDGEKTPSKWGGFIPCIDFDPVSFGIPPQSLAAIEPAQLLALLVAKQALDNAGYSHEKIFNREDVSVIIGAEGGTDLANNYGFRALFRQFFGEMPAELDNALPRLTEDSFPGVLANVIAGRITNRLNLGGRNYTVDAACASSLAAIDLACQELILEKADMVLAGAADLHNGINDYLMFSSTHALSRKGKCMTFDAAADGIALGEGVAMVVLKRLEDARRDGDKIYAVIKGVGGSSDGKSLGLTAPRKAGQIKALERAYEQSGISPATVGLIEAHGTGTVVGDKTELSAISDMLIQSGAVAGQTYLGSVKTQIGHTKCAAGLAGLIKAALSVYHGVKPPTLHLKTPNSYYNESISPFLFNSAAGLWLDEKRRAGISAFGFGGTNFHAVIENASHLADDKPVLKAWPSELFVFRGNTWEEAHSLLHTVRGILENNDSISLKDMAYSLVRYHAKPVQLCIVVNNREDALLKIDLALSSAAAKEIYPLKRLEGKVAFMFPGQGSQRINMARELFVAFPAMRKLLKQQPAYEKILYPPAAFDDAAVKKQKEAIKDTRIAQPTLGIVDLAIASFLRQLGITPDMAAGHSYGELPALCFANAFTADQLIPLSEKRAGAILDAIEDDKGIMVALNCTSEELPAYASPEDGVYPVNHNSQQQWVLAGATPAMQQLMEKLKEAKKTFVQMEVACAFHSPLLSKAEELYKTAISEIPFNAPTIPVWSNTTTTLYPDNADDIKTLLAQHLVKPVRFSEELQQMYAAGARVFIEVGPGKMLSGLIKATIGKDELILHTEDKDQHSITLLLTTIARYIASGREVLLEKLFEGRDAQSLDLDQPAQYKKSNTVWLVNGQLSVPISGKLPSYGAMPVVTPLKLIKPADTQPTLINGNAEYMVQEYLNSIKLMVQAQRDVMLGYLGHSPTTFNRPEILPADTHLSNSYTYTTNGAVPIPEVNGPLAASAIIVKIDIKELLMKVVSDKTGYPVEMLGMEMDLEGDLSIDSIKRMEIIAALRTELGGFKNNSSSDEAVIEQLTAIKTLSSLLQFLTDIAGQATTAPTQEATATIATSPPVKAWSENDIRSTILLIVSEKTGYPEDMLGMDLDMEADLSIDSIKRMEILGELKIKIGGFNQSEDKTEALAGIKTLNGLLSWIVDNILQAATEAATITIQPVVPATQPAATNTGMLSRLRFELSPSQFTAASRTNLEGQKFAITDDGTQVASHIKTLLEQQGATADIITGNHLLEDYHGLVILDLLSSLKKLNLIEVIAIIKKLNPENVKWVYAISDFREQAENVQQLRHLQGYSGFLKSLDKEWEHTKCRSIRLPDQLSVPQIATIVLDEIVHPDPPAEIIYKDTTRQTFELVRSSLAGGNTSSIQLDKEAVVLVLGGAQGITAELMVRFSKDYPCHYILVGRSPDPRHNGHNQYAALKSKDEIKKQLIAEGQLSKPAEIEKHASAIHKSNQILNTITALESYDATVSYHALDIRNEEELIRLISNTYEQYGRIDGVVHGAGLLEDKLFHQKTPESFERVFSTKVTPMRILAEQLRKDTQFVILFSSVASVYGNPGQTDYAAANSVMDHYAWELKKMLKGKVIAINWGPWKGTGMVSPTLEKEYARRGISLIPLQAGMETFVNELKYGSESQVLIMAE